MSAEIVIIITGGFLLLLALIGSIKPSGSSQGLVSPMIRILLGVIGVLVIIYGGYSYGNINFQSPMEKVEVGNVLQVTSPVEEVQVISPLDGDSVNCRILTMGVYPEGHESDIWVLLRPSNDRFYPQSDHTNTSYKRNGEWQVITRFGGDQGESYEIIVYETDQAASQFFSTTIEEWKQMESYPGLERENIPAGAVEVDGIKVSLFENCRGVF